VRRRLAESLLDNVRMSAFEPFSETSLDPPVRGFLHRPESPSGDVLVITHGAGGNSQSSLLLAEEAVADGLLLLSYPLHAPGHPEKPRIEHLPKLQLPTLFVHGTRDPFGTIEEIENARKLIPGKTELLVVDGAGHDLGFKGKTKIEAVPGRVLEACKSLFGMRGL